MREGLSTWDSGAGVPVSVTIQNDGSADDRLLGASTPIAWCVGIQRTQLVDGRPQTTPEPGGLVFPARATVTLEPAASHLALFGLRSDLVQGQTFPLTLYFDRAGEVLVTARVRRKVDAAGSTPLPAVAVGELTVTHVSALPAPAATPDALSRRCWKSTGGST
jgi:copper(I)-binding protein